VGVMGSMAFGGSMTFMFGHFMPLFLPDRIFAAVPVDGILLVPFFHPLILALSIAVGPFWQIVSLLHFANGIMDIIAMISRMFFVSLLHALPPALDQSQITDTLSGSKRSWC